MNHFILQGQILYKEPPKREGGSALVMLLIGRDKEENNNLIQSVNKVIVRVPGRLTQVIDRFGIGEYIEMSGTKVGRVYTPFGSKQSVASVNLVASGIHACSVSHLVKPKQVEGMLFGRYTMSGVVKAVKAPTKENRPHILYLQIERPIMRNEETQEQPTATVPITIHDTNLLRTLEAQMSIVVTGKIIGLLRKMPVLDIEAEFEERLEVGLVGLEVRQCAIIPTKIFESRAERAERLLREKHEGSKDEALEQDELEIIFEESDDESGEIVAAEDCDIEELSDVSNT